MPEEWLAKIPADAVIPIVGVWRHRSCRGQYNFRLEILIGPKLDELFLWDVSVSRWAAIMGKG